jgi:hypothetical protein
MVAHSPTSASVVRAHRSIAFLSGAEGMLKVVANYGSKTDPKALSTLSVLCDIL